MERFRANPIGNPPVPQICEQREIVGFTQLQHMAKIAEREVYQAVATLFENVRSLGNSAAFSFKPGDQGLSLYALYRMHYQALFSAD